MSPHKPLILYAKNSWKAYGQIPVGGDLDSAPATGISASLSSVEINRNHAILACNKIEYSVQEKQYILAVFMDIQGAFDSTIFAAIQEALESCDVGRTVIRWIVNMLKCWNIHLTNPGESVEARVVKGCPQREVLSPHCGE